MVRRAVNPTEEALIDKNNRANAPHDRSPAPLLAIALLALISAGCSTTAMKGTPFFTGEYETRQGAPEDRVNLWPLVYHREPATSVLWPIGEHTDDRLAVRPFFSIEDLDEEEKIYNVLWPLGRFDTQADEHRFFPVFWGDNRAIVFPLYWHTDDPFDKEAPQGVDALWPLWCYFRDDEQRSLHLIWPFFNTKSYEQEKGWRLWPLYGTYSNPNSGRGRSFTLWPLITNKWTSDSHTRTVLPLYYRDRTPDSFTFATLLGGWHRNDTEATGDWYAVPILSWGKHSPTATKRTILLGLGGHRADATGSRSYVLPLFYQRRNGDERFFVSPLYASRHTADDNRWRAWIPLAIRRRTPSSDAFYTLIYSRGTDREKQRQWSCLLPLYYREARPESATFMTLLGGWWHDPGSRNWAALPLLTGVQRRADDSGQAWLLGPLGHASWDAQGSSHWLFPFYAYDHHRDRLLSLPYCSWRKDDQTTTQLVPPLLSAYASGPDRWDLWGPAGLVHASGGAEGGSSHLFPLYYRNPDKGAFISLPYASWNENGLDHRALPLLLSGWKRDDDVTDLYAALGLFRRRWGSDPADSTGHLFPLYWYGSDGLLTPIAGRKTQYGTTTRYWLTPIVGHRTGRETGSWLFPIYGHTGGPAEELSHGWFMLFGRYRHTPAYSRSTFPVVFKHERWRNDEAAIHAHPKTRDGWRFNLLWLGEAARYTYSQKLPAPKSLSPVGPAPASTESVVLRHRKHRCFPLWSVKEDRCTSEAWLRAEGKLLLWLYDSRRERGHTSPQERSEPHDYTRRRVLWRIVHYERLNGVSSLDAFPGITYDRDPTAGKRKLSLLWRCFRYDRDAETTAVDVLFLPVYRKRHDTPPTL